MPVVPVKASPAKTFFVDMLTRDIELKDAILDLLDNCVDGALRSIGGVSAGPHPYQSYWAKISFDRGSFSIEDNCGGIPQDLAENYAFRLGRADPERDRNVPTVGTYGIGMKRAIFKMGHRSVVRSKTADGEFSVTIPRAWMEDDHNWELELSTGEDHLSHVGTTVLVEDLREEISRLFGDETGFEGQLKRSVAEYYGYIISKGFQVFVNDELIEPVRVTFIADQAALDGNRPGVAPFVYETEADGVSVAVMIGLYAPIGSQNEDDEDEFVVNSRPSADRAGWTVICNDRVVLFADKSKVTGWGEANVPLYHPQFVSIAGVVVFKSNDARKLPITTTKRGIEGSSEVYLATKNVMRDGLKMFTDFTNRWKTRSPERTAAMRSAELEVVAVEVAPARWASVRSDLGGRIFRPNLPRPREEDPHRTIQFSRRESEIGEVREFLFDNIPTSNSAVGDKCFEEILLKARK